MARKSDNDGKNGNGQGREIVQVDKRRKEVRKMLHHNHNEIAKALNKMLDPDQFIRICMTHYSRGGDAMMKADPRSFIAACVEAAQLGLKPDSILGECYLIPRWNRDAKCYLVNFQLGYPGVIKLVRRGGEVSDIAPEVVCANDDFQVFLGTDRKIVHKPWYTRGKSEPGDVVAAYATAKLRDGSIAFKVTTKRDLDKAAAASGDPRNKEWSNVWNQHYDAMAMKTAVLRLAKWLPMPDDSKRVISRDEMREAGVMDEDMRATIDTLAQQAHRTEPSPARPSTLDDLVPGPGGPVIDTPPAEGQAGDPAGQ